MRPSHVLAATPRGAAYLREYGRWLRGERQDEPDWQTFDEHEPEGYTPFRPTAEGSSGGRPADQRRSDAEDSNG